MKKVLQETLRQIRGFTRQLLESTDPDWVVEMSDETEVGIGLKDGLRIK